MRSFSLWGDVGVGSRVPLQLAALAVVFVLVPPAPAGEVQVPTKTAVHETAQEDARFTLPAGWRRDLPATSIALPIGKISDGSWTIARMNRF